MVVKENLPYTFVESRAFKIFVKALAPLFELPSKQKLKSQIKSKYVEISSKIKSKLSTVNYLSLTSDLWTNTMTSESFIDVTTHFIFGTKHESITLGVKALDDKHTADNISSWLLSMLKEWNISKDQVFAMVTDNARNISLAATNIFGNCKQMGCFAHLLNLVVSNAIKESTSVNDIIKKVKKIVQHFKHCINDYDKLKKKFL